MKRLATAALAVCLLSGTSALAQPGSHNTANNNSNSSSHSSSSNNQRTNGGPKGPPTNTAQTQTQTIQRQVTQNNNNQNNNNNRNWNNSNNNNNNTNRNNSNQNWNNNNNNHNNNQNWNNNNNHNSNNNQNWNNNNNRNTNNNWWNNNGRNWNGPRPNYSVQQYPHTWRPTQRYAWNGGRWYAPPGFYYRPYYYGQYFPLAWLAQQFWINTYYSYGLPPPPYGYAWVRNGPDALLVNVSNGMVVQLVPGIFY